MNINTATLVDALLLLLLLFHVSAGPHFDKNPKRFSIKRHEFPEKPSKDLITHITISKIGTIEIGSFKEALSNIEGINN